MRILLIDFLIDYINPVKRLWPLIFKRGFDTMIIGPGYCPVSELERGLKHFIDDHGPFDWVVCSEQVLGLNFSTPSTGKQAMVFKSNYHCPFDIKSAIEAMRKLSKEFQEYPGRKAVTHFVFDYFNMHPSHRELLEKTQVYFIGSGEQFHRPPDEFRKMVVKEPFIVEATEHCLDYMKGNPEKIISLPHFISSDEFCSKPLSERKHSWCVVGADYYARREVRSTLDREGLGWNGKTLRYYYKVMSNLKFRGKRLTSLQPITKLTNFWFRRAIENAKYGYTCGSGIGLPIRKFFEIPALGAVLVCTPCNGFEALGFKDGVNALACPPEKIMDVHKNLTTDEAWAQSLATKGQELISESHTLEKRIEQLKMALESILNGTYAGSSWNEGQFVLKTKPGEN